MSDWLDAERHADRALEMFERGRWAEAEDELRKALAMNPDQAEWHFNLGLTLEASGRDAEALDSFEQAVALLPEQVDPLLAAGMVCNRLGRHRDALDFLTRALRLDPANEAAYAGQIEALVRLGEHEEAETAFYLSQQMLEEPSGPCLAGIAEGLIERGQWKRAEWCLRQALRLEPTIPHLRARLASVYAATGRHQRALQMYIRDLREDPGGIDTLLDYGELLARLGRRVEAAEKFRRVLELEPANVDAHVHLGRLAVAEGQHERAQVEFELVHKLDPGYPDIRLHLGETLLALDRHDEATAALLAEYRALNDAGGEGGDDAGPDVDLPRLADGLLAVGRPAEAAEVLESALSLGEAEAGLLRKLALAKFRLGDLEAGAAISRRVLRLDRTCTVSMHNLALAALDRGRFVEAAGWISRGLRVDRDDDALRRLRMRLLLGWVGHGVRHGWRSAWRWWRGRGLRRRQRAAESAVGSAEVPDARSAEGRATAADDGGGASSAPRDAARRSEAVDGR